MLRALLVALSLVAFAGAAVAQQGKAVTTPSGLQYIDNKLGTGAAGAGKTATVHYTGWLYQNGQKGKKFDSSVDSNELFSFPVA